MFPGFDPSKLDPKTIQELTDLMRTLPPEKLMQMQSIMHNSCLLYTSPSPRD